MKIDQEYVWIADSFETPTTGKWVKDTGPYHPVSMWRNVGTSVLVPGCCREIRGGEGYGTALYHLDLNSGEFEEIRPLDGDRYAWSSSGLMWEVIYRETPRIRVWKLEGSLREANLEFVTELAYETRPPYLDRVGTTRNVDGTGILLFAEGTGSGILAREKRGTVEMVAWSETSFPPLLGYRWGRDRIVGFHRSRVAVFKPGDEGLELLDEREVPFDVNLLQVAPDDSMAFIADYTGDTWLLDLRTLELTQVDGPFATAWGTFAPSPEGVRWLSGRFERSEDSISMESVLFLPGGETKRETLRFPAPPTTEGGRNIVRNWAFWQ